MKATTNIAVWHRILTQLNFMAIHQLTVMIPTFNYHVMFQETRDIIQWIYNIWKTYKDSIQLKNPLKHLQICPTYYIYIYTTISVMATSILYNFVIIGSGNGLSAWHQAITWTNGWVIINWTHRSKLQWNFIQNITFSVKKKAFENISKMLAILDRLQCVQPGQLLH